MTRETAAATEFGLADGMTTERARFGAAWSWE